MDLKALLWHYDSAWFDAWQMGFQFPSTSMMEGIITLHHDIMAFLVLIITFVLLLFVGLLSKFVVAEQGRGFMQFFSAHGITHNTVLETVWTVIPTFILLLIATPSFALVYALDEVLDAELAVRVIGRQWYWSYEYAPLVLASENAFDTAYATTRAELAMDVLDSLSGLSNLTKQTFWNTYLSQMAFEGVQLPDPGYVVPGFTLNSYLVGLDDLVEGAPRLLETDRRIVIPVQTNVRFLITSSDVIHSWAVPSFGVKVDALPGRVNEYILNANYLGVFYGQCSEICGVNHGFMPIKVEVATPGLYMNWLILTSIAEAPAWAWSCTKVALGRV